LATANEWRARAEKEKLSIRALVVAVGNRQTFVGSPSTIAETINHLVQQDASDGFILVPHIIPRGLDQFADTVVPLLQERGVFRSEYEGTTLRDHLGLEPLTVATQHLTAN
jgi:alkanesulfonate monooxygenase SsuD/methylene tetrahydromethanopterin reductase-like flavin-dependent oxidoreductase (luciferase family)